MSSSLILEPIKFKMMLKTIFSFYKQFFFRGIGYGVLICIPLFIYIAVYGVDSLSNYNTLAVIPLAIVSLTSLFLFSLSFAAICKSTSQLYLKQPVDWNFANKTVINSAWRFSGVFFASHLWIFLKSILPLIGSFIVFFAVMYLFDIQDINNGIILLIFVGIPAAINYILNYINYALVIPVASEENTQIKNSLNRSRDLVSGNRWRVFAFIIFIVFLPFVINFALGFIVDAILVNFTSMDIQAIILTSFAIDSIVKISLMALNPIIITLLYFDLKARKMIIQKNLTISETEVPVA